MKSLIEKLNKSFENRIRLGIMSSLMVNREVDFLSLKEWLDVTDGNLATHIAALEKEQYLIVTKSFEGKKTKTTYSITKAGKAAFTSHLHALEKLIKTNK